DGETAEDVLEHAAAVESRSEHPIARAIAAAGEHAGAGALAPAETGTVGADGTGGTDPMLGADGVEIGALEVRAIVSGAGVGVSGVVRRAHDGLGLARRVLVGRESWLADQGVAVPESLSATVAEGEE